MAGDEAVAGWIANKLRDGKHFTIAPIGAGFLKISREGCATFTLAAIGVTDVIRPNHVLPLFESVERPPRTAAESMGAEALKFGELMARLNRR